jgi:hypothetical protein
VPDQCALILSDEVSVSLRPEVPLMGGIPFYSDSASGMDSLKWNCAKVRGKRYHINSPSIAKAKMTQKRKGQNVVTSSQISTQGWLKA